MAGMKIHKWTSDDFLSRDDVAAADDDGGPPARLIEDCGEELREKERQCSGWNASVFSSAPITRISGYLFPVGVMSWTWTPSSLPWMEMSVLILPSAASP